MCVCVCVCVCVCYLCVNHLFQRPTVMNINVSLWSGMERMHACLLQPPLKKTLNGFVLFLLQVFMIQWEWSTRGWSIHCLRARQQPVKS